MDLQARFICLGGLGDRARIVPLALLVRDNDCRHDSGKRSKRLNLQRRMALPVSDECTLAGIGVLDTISVLRALARSTRRPSDVMFGATPHVFSPRSDKNLTAIS